MMKAIARSLKSRMSRLAILLVVLGSAAGLLSPVEEAQSAICRFRPVIRTYYSDATYTTEVGQRGVDCACESVFWGVTSAFVQSETLCCPIKTC